MPNTIIVIVDVILSIAQHYKIPAVLHHFLTTHLCHKSDDCKHMGMLPLVTIHVANATVSSQLNTFYHLYTLDVIPMRRFTRVQWTPSNPDFLGHKKLSALYWGVRYSAGNLFSFSKGLSYCTCPEWCNVQLTINLSCLDHKALGTLEAIVTSFWSSRAILLLWRGILSEVCKFCSGLSVLCIEVILLGQNFMSVLWNSMMSAFQG